jgi:hypothetical protein
MREELNLLSKERAIRTESPYSIKVGSKSYTIKSISNAVRRRINDLEIEAYSLEEASKEKMSLRQAKRISNKIRTLHSRTAAYYLLGNWAIFLPPVYWVVWRWLDLQDSEHTFKINEAGINAPEVGFFLANWQITKTQLALSMSLVGKGIKHYQERLESAENMLEEDALPKREDDR